jgi:putative serine protease PepD
MKLWNRAAVALIAGAALGAAVTAGVILSVTDDGGGSDSNEQAVATTPAPTAERTSGSLSTGDCMSAADVYELVSPAVVRVANQASSDFGFSQEGSGSGIVLDTDGTILTNNHVVDGAETLEVRFADNTTVPATIIGVDPGNDLAVIRADLGGYTPTVAKLGNSTALRVGDPVLAIGEPFQLEGTLTRTFSPGGNTRPIRNMIQTDAAINPGNSGGPLINCQGEVVGVNTLLENPTGDNVNVGIGFAVPINTAKSSMDELLAGATVNHPWLGIAGREITPALADELGLDTDSGVYVTYVSADGPASRAGIEGAFASEAEAAQSSETVAGGDAITAVDGQEVASVEELAAYLDENKKPGDEVELRLERDGDEITVRATLAEWPG